MTTAIHRILSQLGSFKSSVEIILMANQVRTIASFINHHLLQCWTCLLLSLINGVLIKSPPKVFCTRRLFIYQLYYLTEQFTKTVIVSRNDSNYDNSIVLSKIHFGCQCIRILIFKWKNLKTISLNSSVSQKLSPYINPVQKANCILHSGYI